MVDDEVGEADEKVVIEVEEDAELTDERPIGSHHSLSLTDRYQSIYF